MRSQRSLNARARPPPGDKRAFPNRAPTPEIFHTNFSDPLNNLTPSRSIPFPPAGEIFICVAHLTSRNGLSGNTRIIKCDNMDNRPSVYVPIRLPRRAVEKLDRIATERLCATRAEAIRRLIDEARTDDQEAAA